MPETPIQTSGLSITKKILLPFLVIIFVLGLVASLGSARLIKNAFINQTDQELLVAREVLDREIKEREQLLHLFCDMLRNSHSNQLGDTLQPLALGEGNLYVGLIDPTTLDENESPQLKQLTTLALRSDKAQLRVFNNHDNIPTMMLVEPVTEFPGRLLTITSSLDQDFLLDITGPLKIDVQVLSLDNKVLVTTDIDAPQLPDLSTDELEGILSGGLVFKTRSVGADVRFLFCAVPLGTTDLIILSINRPMATLQRTISTLTAHAAITVGLVLLLGGYLFFSIVRRVMRPLDELMDATKAIRAGNHDHQVRVKSNDEYEHLADSFNSMMSDLSSLYNDKLAQEKHLAHAREELKYKEILEAKNSEIERANLGLRNHLKEMSALFNLNQAMASSLEINVLFDRMISVLRDLLHCQKIVLFTYNPGNEELTVRKSFGVDLELLQGTVFHLDEGITGKTALQQQLIHIPDLESDARNLNYKGRSISEGSMVSVPLVIKNRLSGVLNLHKFEIDAFSPNDLKLIQAIANQAAVAIENSQLYEKARNLSNTDELTGLANRRHFQMILKREVAQSQRYSSHFSLVMADLDNFKAYNDTHGHLKGDILLKKVSRLLLQNTRGIDLVARFGGEEFVILLPKTTAEGAWAAAEKLRVSIMAEKFDGIQESHPQGCMTVSMGIAEYPKDSSDIYELLDLADRALYRAKGEGKNRVLIWRGGAEHAAAE